MSDEPTEWIIDLYPGQERWGRIVADDGVGGFVIAVWNTGTITRTRHGSVRDVARWRGGRRGKYRSTSAEGLVDLLVGANRHDLAAQLTGNAP